MLNNPASKRENTNPPCPVHSPPLLTHWQFWKQLKCLLMGSATPLVEGWGHDRTSRIKSDFWFGRATFSDYFRLTRPPRPPLAGRGGAESISDETELYIAIKYLLHLYKRSIVSTACRG